MRPSGQPVMNDQHANLSWQRKPGRWALRLAPAALTLIVLGFGLLLGNDLMVSRQRDYGQVRRDSENLARFLEREVAAAVEKIDVVIRDVAHEFSPAVASGQARDLLEANLDLQRSMAFIPEAQQDSLRVINAEGRVIYNAGASAALPDVVVADRTYFQRQKANPNAGLIVSEPLLSRFTGKWLITFSRSIPSKDGSFVGLVQTALRTEYFQSLFEALDVDAYSSVTLLDTESRLLSRHPASPGQLGKPMETPGLMAALANGQASGSFEVSSSVDHVNRIFVYKKLGYLPYILVIGRSPEEFLTGWRRTTWLYGISFLGLVLVMASFLRLLHRYTEENRHLVVQVFESSGEGIMVTDDIGRIVTANKAFTAITGYDLGDVVGRRPTILKSGRHDKAFYTNLWALLQTEGRWRGKVWNRRKSGEVYPELLSISALRDRNGRTTHFIGVFADITELERTKSQAEAANRAKTAFLATMSHELRTPLNVILGFVDLVLQQTFGPVGDDEYLDHAHDAREAGQHLLSLISDILDYSRLEAGSMKLPMASVPVAASVDSALRMLRKNIEQSGIQVAVDVPDAIADLWANERAVRQILTNLLSNALKFTPAGGRITIRACDTVTEHPKPRKPQRAVSITVSDTGLGIPADQLEHVLLPFEQLDHHLTRKHQGTGLGLAIVHGLVKLQGGLLVIESEVTAGTNITVILPAEHSRRPP